MAWNKLNTAVLTVPILTGLQNSQQSGASWSHRAHDVMKGLLKDALFEAQQSRCGYCRREIRDETGRVEIDHILPKAPTTHQANAASNHPRHRRSTAGYPHFTFCGHNLVLTCKRCNNKKGMHDARADRTQAIPIAYPADPNAYIWVHPYFHDYSEHIEIAQGYVFRPVNNSEGGKAVIKECKLNTLAAVETKAVERALKNAPNLEQALMAIWIQPDLNAEQGAVALTLQFQSLQFDQVREVLARFGRTLTDLTATAAEIRAMLA